MKVVDAHRELLAFSGKDAGIGISIELISRLIELQIKRLNSYYEKIPSNQDFKALKVKFSGKIDASTISVKFEEIKNPNDRSQSFPVVNIKGLKLEITGFLDGTEMVGIVIDYKKIIGRIQLIRKRLELTLLEERHEETSFDKKWEIDQTVEDKFVKEPYSFIENDWHDLTIHFKATSVFSGGPIASTIIESIDMPNIFKVFHGIKFKKSGQLGSDSTGELLMFTAESSLDFSNCAITSAKGQTNVTSRSINQNTSESESKAMALQTEEGVVYNNSVVVEATIDEDSPSLRYPDENGDDEDDSIEHLSSGDVFLFTPHDLLSVNFDIVKPAVSASDSGRFGPFYWRYAVTAAVPRIRLVLTRNWPIEFKLSIPSDVRGQAGAGIKIGCIRYEAVGAMFDGKVDPLEVLFKIRLDWSRKQIVFTSRMGQVKGRDFRFRTFPRLQFPISEILDFILGEASEYVISDQADQLLSVTRIPIANLKLLEKVAKLIPNSMAGESDGMGNVTMGIKFKT